MHSDMLCLLQVVSDGLPLVQAVVPKNQTRSFINQGSDILVRFSWTLSQGPTIQPSLQLQIHFKKLFSIFVMWHCFSAGECEFKRADRDTQLAAIRQKHFQLLHLH